MFLSSVLWQKMLLQSLTVFFILFGLGLVLLAVTALWPQARRRHRAASRLE